MLMVFGNVQEIVAGLIMEQDGLDSVLASGISSTGDRVGLLHDDRQDRYLVPWPIRIDQYEIPVPMDVRQNLRDIEEDRKNAVKDDDK